MMTFLIVFAILVLCSLIGWSRILGELTKWVASMGAMFAGFWLGVDVLGWAGFTATIPGIVLFVLVLGIIMLIERQRPPDTGKHRRRDRHGSRRRHLRE